LINRRVHQTEAGVLTKKNQKLVLTITPQTLQPVEATQQYNSTLVELFQQAKSDPNVLHIQQVCIPYESAENPGEAIFPEEQDLLGISYTTVQAPDLGPVPSTLPTIFTQ
jgi:hypothetical protein